MRVLVAGGFDLSSQRAHAINTIKMAQGFARCGHQVALLCRSSGEGKIPFGRVYENYGITEPLHLLQVPHSSGQHWRFAALSLPYILLFRPNLVYSRNYLLPWLTSKLGIPTIGESHAHTDNNTKEFLRFVSATKYTAFIAWITISPYLEAHYYSLGVPSGKIKVLPDAVDLNIFSRPKELPQSPYPGNGPNIVYAGHLYEYKGIPIILKAAKLLPNYTFHLVGGLPDDIDRQQNNIRALGLKNVMLHGFSPHSKVPRYLWHADILLLPPSRNHISSNWTSPVKLGEYLAAGVPVVASDIPALRYWLSDEEVVFFESDNELELARVIKTTLGNIDLSRSLIESSLLKAKQLSYTQRARQILESL